MGEVSKRAKVGMGIGPGNMLADHVHANLVEPAALASDATKMFGKAVEKLLIKHGNGLSSISIVISQSVSVCLAVHSCHFE